MTAWPNVKLGEVANFIRGVTFKPADVVPLDTPGTVRCMRTKNVQQQLDMSDVWSIDASLVKRTEQYLQSGDLLISSANSWNIVGKCSWVPELDAKTSFGGFVTALRPNPELIEPRYLYRYFSSSITQATVRSFARQTTNISNLDLKRCATLQVPLPPLPEQRRIAAILDHVDGLRVKRHEVLEGLNELTRSIFIDMFGDPGSNPMGWEVAVLSELVEVGDKINYGVVQPGEDVEGGVPLIRAGDLADGAVDTRALRSISPDVHARHRRSRLVGDEILVSCVGSIGEVALATPELHGFNIARAVARVRVGDSVRRHYVAACLATPGIRNYFLRELRTVAQPTLNIKQIEATLIPVPPIRDQDEFTRRFASAVEMRAKDQVALAELDALFSSLQNRAFRGEL